MPTKAPPRNKAANHAVEFLNALTLSGEFIGQKVKLRPWQESIIRRLFGTLDKAGKRTIRKCLILLPP